MNVGYHTKTTKNHIRSRGYEFIRSTNEPLRTEWKFKEKERSDALYENSSYAWIRTKSKSMFSFFFHLSLCFFLSNSTDFLGNKLQLTISSIIYFKNRLKWIFDCRQKQQKMKKYQFFRLFVSIEMRLDKKKCSENRFMASEEYWHV